MAPERNRRIWLGAATGLVQRAAQLLSTLITFPLVLHALGIAGFGIWAASSSLGWLAGVVDLGLGSALLTLLPASFATDGGVAAQRHVSAALSAGMGLALLGLAGCALFAAREGADGASAPFLIAALAMAINIPLSIARNIWFGLHKAHVANAWDLGQTILTLVLVAAAALAQGGLLALVAAVYAAMLVTNASSLAHALLGHPALRPKLWRSAGDVRDIFGRGGQMLAITIAALCVYAFDNLLVLAWAGPAAAARIAVALRVCTTILGLFSVITQPFWPALAEAAARADHRWVSRTTRRGTLLICLAAGLSGAVIITCGAPVLTFWLRRDLDFSQAMLWMMAAWVLALSCTRFAELYLLAVLRLRLQIALLSLGACGALLLKYLLIGRFGVPGVLGATALAWMVLVAPGYAWAVWRRMPAPQAGLGLSTKPAA
jgi:O-antigen/teichoic acid export membrane protein